MKNNQSKFNWNILIAIGLISGGFAQQMLSLDQKTTMEKQDPQEQPIHSIAPLEVKAKRVSAITGKEPAPNELHIVVVSASCPDSDDQPNIEGLIAANR